MGKLINHKEAQVMSYEALSRRVLALAKMEDYLMGDRVPNETSISWRIGQTLAWYAEDLLEQLAFHLRRQAKTSWQARDLAEMTQLYLHYPTVEKLSLKEMSQRHDLSLKR